MKSKSLFIIVHLYIPTILCDDLSDAFYSKSMFSLISFFGNRRMIARCEGVVSAGVDYSQDHKISRVFLKYVYFNITASNPRGGHQGINHQLLH